MEEKTGGPAMEFPLWIDGRRIDVCRHENVNKTRGEWLGMSHNHAAWELHVILDGAAVVEVDGKPLRVEKKQALIIAPGLYHNPVAVEGNFDRFSITFEMEEGALQDALREKVPDRVAFSVTGEVLGVCRSLFAESHHGAPFSMDVLPGLLTRLLVCCFRLLQIRPASPSPLAPPITKGWRNDRIDAWFETHLHTSAKAEDLAEKLFVSRRQLSRILQECYGMNFRDKLLQARIDRAMWLLRHTDKPVGEIAEAVGYTAPSSFYHVFRLRCGMTPDRYREKGSGV
jgi:AraC-like DNA-binding protein